MQKEHNEVNVLKSREEEPNLFLDLKSTKKISLWGWVVFAAVVALISAGIIILKPGFGIKAEGIVKAKRRVEIGATQPGVLKEVLHQKGDFVNQGEILAKLQNNDLEGDLLERRFDLQMLKQDSELIQNKIDYLEKRILEKLLLFENGLIGKSWVEKIRFEINQDKEIKAIKEKQVEAVGKQITFLEEKLRALEIRAPFSGVILKDSNSEMGNSIKDGENLFELADPKSLYLEAAVPENEVRRIREGDSAKIQFEAFKGQTVFGKVTRAGASAEKEIEKVFKVKHIVPCEVELENIPSGLKYGMVARIKIHPANKGVRK